MLSAIKEIGYLVSTKAISSDRRIEGKIFAIVLNNDNSSFQEISVEDFDVEKISRYLYRERATRGTTPAPIAQITEPDKTFNKKVRKWLADCETLIDIEDKNFEFYRGINQTLKDNKSEIIAAITEKLNNLNLPKKNKKFLAVKLEGGKKFLGDYDVFRKAVSHFANEKTSKSSAISNVCSVCGELKDKVSARTFVYQFDTDDKPGSIAGGFDKDNNWKNIPVCEDCRTLLKHGRGFIDSKLNFKFYGLNYSLIPRLLTGNKEILEEIISILSDTTQTVSLRNRIKKRITEDEREILDYLADKKDDLTLNFLFLQRQQSAERILLLIEDVFPSRIRAIFNAKNDVDAAFNDNFTFFKIRTFFSMSDKKKRKSDLNKYFLEIVDSVFKDRRLDFSFLTKFHMAVIRRELMKVKEKDWDFKNSIRDALMNTMFFENLGLITFEEVKDMEESIFEVVFKNYGNTFASPTKRGIFLLGVLTQKLLNIQAYKRGAKPFMKKLKSLKMSQKDIIGLLPAVQYKLEEYESFDTWRKLAQESSKYLLAQTDDWKLSVDEINFYFACGMNLMEQITAIIYPENKKEE
ncbi:MAG: TIGR02556 family CRISPR-associated protein [Thermodesulfobacteriota bacterium]|nr:TIGR02556 family CRISPR-associated protein [Thermodesulfobacteriota bacterium]